MMNKKVLAFATTLTIGAGAFAVSADAAETHKIQPGETLWSISQKYGTTVENLKVANGLGSDIIYAGQTLNIKGKAVANTSGFYVIQPQDTLFKIAQAHGTTVANLKAWNGLSSDMIYVGDSLAVTAANASYTAPAVAAKKQAQAQPQTQQQPQQQAVVASSQPVATQAPASASRTLTMVATAYTAYCNGCSGVTANGTNLRANPNLKVIAVDPNVIPLGTRVWVEGYGEAIAADTGGAIKGNKIDVFIPSDSGALNWGRRTVTVKVLN